MPRELLVILHGLGGTGDLGQVVGEHWDGPVHAPDLAGHGRAGRLATYTFRRMAEDVAAGLPRSASYVVLGHSLGGVVGLELARLVGGVRRVVGLGIKVEWSDEDLAWAHGMATRPVAWFDTADEAVSRHRRVAGIEDLVADDVARRGVLEEHGRWRLALDPRAFGVGRPDMPALVQDAVARGVEVVLARGERDRMQTDEQLRALVPDPVTLPGLGHSAHLEDPAAVLRLL